ncbi:MAG: ilvE [Gemmatimonadetes bacterium]|nr:ilvE [Gemmatimonadota bacterium]
MPSSTTAAGVELPAISPRRARGAAYAVDGAPGAARDLQEVCLGARVFVSMPFLEGVTPRVLREHAGSASYPCDEPLERRHGVFRVDEIGLPLFDHGLLYGDSVFEGVLVVDGRLFLWREHLERLHASARRLRISVPYDDVDLTRHTLEAVEAMGLAAGDRAYVRLVVSRGLGDLGINPRKCLGSTVYAIAAKLAVYPEAAYRRGIAVSVSRNVRRNGQDNVDPRVKSSNYLNNILALLDTIDEGTLETMMLTRDGYVSEATADNLFLVSREPGWEADPAKVTVSTPTEDYCLNGITRQLLMRIAAEEGHAVRVLRNMLPSDWRGPDREAFLTGTGAGLMAVTAVDGQALGEGEAGPVTRRLRERFLAELADPANGVAVGASDEAIRAYLS